MTEERSSDNRTVEVSFDDFYRSEYAPVVRLAFALTGRRELAEELAQEGFIAAHRRWATGGCPGCRGS